MGTCWQCGTSVQVSKTWALTCPETVQLRPCMTREIKTWLSDSRVGNNSVVYHRSRWPVLSSLHDCVDRCHVWPRWALRCKAWRWTLKDISIHRPIWGRASMIWSILSVAALRRREGTLLSTGSHTNCMVAALRHRLSHDHEQQKILSSLDMWFLKYANRQTHRHNNHTT